MTETLVAEVAGPSTGDPDPAGGGGFQDPPPTKTATPAGQSTYTHGLLSTGENRGD
jgi:hypothetical protein